jgi:hypothetical protein
MEQLAELGFVDNRDSARDQPTVRDPLGAFNSPTSSLLAVAAPAATVPGEPGLRGADRRFSSAPVTQQRGGSLTASALKPRSKLANRNPLSLRTCAQVSKPNIRRCGSGFTCFRRHPARDQHRMAFGTCFCCVNHGSTSLVSTRRLKLI